MANVSRFNGTSGTLIIDYSNEKITYDRSTGMAAGTLGLKDLWFNFSDITGIEIRQPDFWKIGAIDFVVNGNRLTTKRVSDLKSALVCDATQFAVRNKGEFNRLAQELRTLASQKNIQVGAIGSINAEFGLVEEVLGKTEKRMVCNVCGNLFCYSSNDLMKNKALQKDASRMRKVGVGQILFTSMVVGNQTTAQAQQLESQIVDFSKCPHCGSTDLIELSRDEFEQRKSQLNNSKSGTVSNADELKKFKELLDMGAITQEEFDAKKKQLLGL